MSFRSRPRRRCWHFCANCPAWPEDYEPHDTDDDPPFDRWCRTCVRMYEAGTGELEDTYEWFPSRVFLALSNAFSAGLLDLRQRDDEPSQGRESQKMHQPPPPRGSNG